MDKSIPNDRFTPNSEKFQLSPPDNRLAPNRLNSESRPELQLKDKKLQKSDREKLRRNRLNEQFAELGKTLDPERPKFDKATILGDTIQMLNDLAAQVSRLKSEYATLSEESRELTQEKHDLREEKASLKSDIDNLNLQYQQRVRANYPWGAMDQSMVMHPPSYTYPVPVPIPPGSFSSFSYPFFGNQSQNSNFIQSVQYVSPIVHPSTRSHVSSREGSRNKSSEQGEGRSGKDEDSNDVVTELELKTPGSTGDQDVSLIGPKSKKLHREENSISDGSSSSKCSSSRTVQAASSSNSVVGSANASN